MATKSALITAVNGFITAVQSIANHRLSMLEIINELFSTTTTQVVNSGSNVFYCSLNYRKTGNKVYVHGWVQNKYIVSKVGTNLITFPNSVFYAKTGEETNWVGITEDTSANVLISFSSTTIYLIGVLVANQKIYINTTYITND